MTRWYLYGNHTTKGSFFRLLARASADGLSMCLRRREVDDGLVTDAEYIEMRDVINPGARAYTLVPLRAVEMALRTFGSTDSSEALASALGLAPIETALSPTKSERTRRKAGDSSLYQSSIVNDQVNCATHSHRVCSQ